MSKRVARALALSVLVLGAFGCSRSTQKRPLRLAILPFENLTGEGSLDWISQTGPTVLAQQIAGLGKFTPLRVSAVRDAYANQAAEIVHTSLTRRAGKIHLESVVEDLTAHTTLDAPAGDHSSVLAAIDQIAQRIDHNARAFATANDEALVAWSSGDFQKAIQIDPDFGPAWESWINQLAATQNRAQAKDVAAQALARPKLNSPLERAHIELFTATEARDMVTRRNVLRRIADMVPGDATAWIAAAEGESLARNFAEAVSLYKHALILEPDNAAALNGWGYAEGEAGDLAQAKVVLEQYGKEQYGLEQYGRDPRQNTNSLDSLGEVYFMNGKFTEAEAYFQQVFARDAHFLDGLPMMKAAYARWLAGDLPGADGLFAKFLEHRSKNGDTMVIWREASWLYTTGRPDAALNKLDQASLKSQSAELQSAMNRQRSVWKGDVQPPQDLAVLKNLYETTLPAADALPRTMYAAILWKMGRNDEARALLKRWPLPDSAGDPMLQSLVYPQYLALRKQLQMQ